MRNQNLNLNLQAAWHEGRQEYSGGFQLGLDSTPTTEPRESMPSAGIELTVLDELESQKS